MFAPILVLRWPHTSLASFVPLLCLRESFPRSFHIRTHLCMLRPSLPAPFYALLPTLSPPAEGGLLSVPFPSGELQSPPFSLFSVFLLDVFSSSQKSVCLPRTLTHLLLWLSTHAFCLILLTHKSKFLSHCLYTPTSSLLDHVLCAFACLSLMSVPSTTFLFTHDPLYRMH